VPAAKFWADRLEKRFAAVLKGKDRPADNAERLAFAWLACERKHFALGASLWAEALVSDPRLGDDLQAAHRYNAACAAALAAAAQGKDAGKLDDKERARLRKQALDWLRADLTLCTKQLESDQATDRAEVQRFMKHWQESKDFAAIRDKDALEKLPDEERKAFTQLWADAAALLKKAEENAK
jgi:hypothetical protein